MTLAYLFYLAWHKKHYMAKRMMLYMLCCVDNHYWRDYWQQSWVTLVYWLLIGNLILIFVTLHFIYSFSVGVCIDRNLILIWIGLQSVWYVLNNNTVAILNINSIHMTTITNSFCDLWFENLVIYDLWRNKPNHI